MSALISTGIEYVLSSIESVPYLQVHDSYWTHAADVEVRAGASAQI